MSKPKSAGGGGAMNYLVEHGEKVAVCAAGGLAFLLMAVAILYWMSADNPDEMTTGLQQATQQVQVACNSNSPPTGNDKPPPDAGSQVAQLDTNLVLASKYEMAALRATEGGARVSRQQPNVLNVVEASAAVARVQIKSYNLYTVEGKQFISTLKIEGATGPTATNLAGKFSGSPAGMGGRGGGGRGARGTRTGLAPGAALAEADKKKDYKVVGVPVEDYEKKGGDPPMVVIRPHRLAVIAASFPLEEQVEEFRKKLGLASNQEVLSELSEDAPKGKKAPFSFRFVGVDVRRRELDGDGKPVGDWEELDLADSYREFIRASGREYEQDTGSYVRLKFAGLVMPKLKQFRPEEFGFSAVGGNMYPAGGMYGPGGRGTVGGTPMPMGAAGGEEGATAKDFKSTPSQYPPVENDLKRLDEALAALKKEEEKNKVAVAGPKRFGDDKDDPFGANTDTPAGRDGPGVGPGTLPMPPDMGMGPGMKPAATVLPKFCLVRVIDVTIEPGKTYEYQLRIRMANPNFGRDDVSTPEFKRHKYLVSNWSTIPIKVAVTPELIYYAVDQALADGKTKAAKMSADKAQKYIALQAHRWLADFLLPGTKDTKMVVGEWAVAERMLVARGQYLGREEDVKLPVWRPQQQSYVLPDLVKRKKNQRVMPVPFQYEEGDITRPVAPQAILVDFEQRGERGYDRITREGAEGALPERSMVTDEAAAQALIMSPTGKLILREAAVDLADEERSQRLSDFRKRIKEVEKKIDDFDTGRR